MHRWILALSILAIRSNELSEGLRGWLIVMKFCSNRAIDANIGVEHSRAERSCGGEATGTSERVAIYAV